MPSSASPIFQREISMTNTLNLSLAASAVLAMAAGSAIGGTAVAAEVAKEKCYGVALKGKNDCADGQTGRASGRERVCMSGEHRVVAESLKKKNKLKRHTTTNNT